MKSNLFAHIALVTTSLMSLPVLAQIPRLAGSPDLSASKYRSILKQNPNCQEFEGFLFNRQFEASQNKKKFTKDQMMLTDQIMVYRRGKVYYENNDGTYTAQSRHCLWSASKSITATLVGAAIQQGELSANQKLSAFFPANQWHPLDSRSKKSYEQVTLRDLLSMSSSFQWNEGYDDDPIHSTFMKMLYGNGRGDMLKFALSQPMSEFQPGTRWIYSGGNSLILMGVLKQIAEKKGLTIRQYMNQLLFGPLEMDGAYIEEDIKGVPIGNSYAFFTPEEMLKLGILYLQNGEYQGKKILSDSWIADSLKKSDGIMHPGLISKKHGALEFTKLKDLVVKEGAYSQTGFWLNQDVPQLLSHEFKNSPKDIYFAAGHYGQLIVVIPSEQTVIVRTGHDSDYWSRMDKIVSTTLGCSRALESSNGKK